MSIKKQGGIWFAKIGRLGGSFYITKKAWRSFYVGGNSIHINPKGQVFVLDMHD
jgi:hypothetical protein